MMSTVGDPYYVAKDEVVAALKKLQGMHEEWKRRLHSENTARSNRFQELHVEITGELRQLDFDLQDITATISMVEENRAKFNFDNAEIASRKNFVSTSRTTVREIQDSVTSRAALGKIEADKRSLITPASSSSSKVNVAETQRRMVKDNQEFLEKQRRDQVQLVAEQDVALSELSASAQRLGVTAQTINNELREQQQMLQALDEDIDRETEKMNFVMKRVGRLLKTSDSKQLCLIIGLFVLMVMLIFLIIS